MDGRMLISQGTGRCGVWMVNDLVSFMPVPSPHSLNILGMFFYSLVLYSRKYWQGLKFGGLAVGKATVKLKSANISYARIQVWRYRTYILLMLAIIGHPGDQVNNA